MFLTAAACAATAAISVALTAGVGSATRVDSPADLLPFGRNREMSQAVADVGGAASNELVRSVYGQPCERAAARRTAGYG